MKKGFTLIELLAVIIILAVVALIATPIVLNVVEDAKKSAAKSQTGLILDSAKLYYAERYFKTENSFEGYECSIANKIGCNELSLEGDKPDQAILSISKQGKVNGKVVVGKYTYYICDNKISETEDCKVLDYTEIYEITSDGTITGVKDSEYVTNKEVTIPEFIGEVEVSKIASNTFADTEITKVTILANKAIIIEENALPETVTKLVVKSCYADSYSEYADILEVIQVDCGTGDAESNIVCKRATELHTEDCVQTNSNYYCSGAGYKGKLITYGNETITEGSLTSGDPFTCDVDGNGDFDEETERFYYVADLSSDSNYAVLIYYNNFANGVADNTSKVAYDLNVTNYNGPVTAATYLPTTTQWSNVGLSSTSRQITNSRGDTEINGVMLQTFNYEGYAARLLTHQEVVSACGTGTVTSTGYLDSCNYLMENTQYSSGSIGTNGYWLETPTASNATSVAQIFANFRYVYNSISASSTSYAGVRPVIEVPKVNIEY